MRLRRNAGFIESRRHQSAALRRAADARVAYEIARGLERLVQDDATFPELGDRSADPRMAQLPDEMQTLVKLCAVRFGVSTADVITAARAMGALPC
jgi:hypothetical protein